jgi:hypothetical protein
LSVSNFIARIIAKPADKFYGYNNIGALGCPLRASAPIPPGVPVGYHSTDTEELSSFEQRYGFSSEEFERRFEALELGEHLDFIEWAGEIKTYRLLEAQGDALEQATVR